MKTSVIATTALVALLVAGVAAIAFASPTTTTNTTNSSSTTTTHGHNGNNGNNGTRDNDNDDQGHQGHPHGACANLAANQTVTIANLTGHFRGFTGNTTSFGNASGSFSFKVGQTFLVGCTLTITGGSVTLGNNTFTVTGGSLVLNWGGRVGSGSGTTSSGSFLIGLDGLHGNSTSASVGAIKLDLKSGSSEYLVILGTHGSDHGED